MLALLFCCFGKGKKSRESWETGSERYRTHRLERKKTDFLVHEGKISAVFFIQTGSFRIFALLRSVNNVRRRKILSVFFTKKNNGGPQKISFLWQNVNFCTNIQTLKRYTSHQVEEENKGQITNIFGKRPQTAESILSKVNFRSCLRKLLDRNLLLGSVYGN